ncbi:YgfZ/GcvT domain-containing protein [Altererythrobacter sp. MF3-039]|uniref:CAF17-like 4Fe-4S cluster assembly/insertion protein YgfZ n=1 Tax=Altererythrobacter sp. MF3-039 TaxID=3252901 RepID=UPI00390CA855
MTATLLFDRKVVRVSPRDSSENAAEFLQGLVTNDVSKELPTYAALLSPQGKTLFDFLVWRDGKDLLLDCETAVAGDLVKRLSLYRLRRQIDIALDESLAVRWSNDPIEGGSSDPRLAALGYRWIAPISDTDEPADKAWRAHRLSLGVPEGQRELGDVLWLETNAHELNGVSFEKGCYIGQENTARMNWRQKVNRRLVVVPLERSDEQRRKVAYDELGLAVDHLRMDDIAPELLPVWLRLKST